MTIDTTVEDLANIDQYESKELKFENDIKSHYFGIGLPIFFREEIESLDENVHLFINPIIGGTNQPTQDYLTNLIKNTPIRRHWAFFYAIQFRLNEEKIGVAFTGEVRGLLKKDNAPFVSLALTKKFDLTKFLVFK